MKKNWDKIATEQFLSLDTDTQREWSDLHELTSHRHLSEA